MSPSTPPRAKVLIVDDHPAVREALSFRITSLADLEVCGEAADPSEALRLVAETGPDIAIIDISLKNGNGLDLIKRIKAKGKKMRMLVWSMHGESLYAERALRAGAMGYITKEAAMAEMIQAIRQVLQGKVYLGPNMTEKFLHRAVGVGRSTGDGSAVDALSDRELEVFRLIGQGERTSEIAARLNLSLGSIWTYRNRIREKLDLSDGTELAHYAAQWIQDNG